MSPTSRPARPARAARRPALILLVAVLAVLTTASPAGAVDTATTTTTQVTTGQVTAVAASGCTAYSGARSLGTSYSDARVVIRTCGARPSFDGARTDRGSKVLPYAGSRIYYSGYQCIELVARYLRARFDAAPGIANGAQAVDRYAAAYPTKFRKIANGTRRSAPRAGDVLSLSGSRYFNDVGHTGIVIRSSVGRWGNGTIRAAEQNFGGATGARGYHDYTVKRWRVVFTGLPHIKWLRAR